MEKVKVSFFFYLIGDILTKVLLKRFFCSPLFYILILSKLMILIHCHVNRNIKGAVSIRPVC